MYRITKKESINKCCKCGKVVTEREIASRTFNGDPLCLPCINAMVPGPPKNRIIKGSELAQRG